ncbi:hypothetical protein P9Y32_19360, partial [Bacillus cereus]|nr:hypothetical protein [Bacillus cereus]
YDLVVPFSNASFNTCLIGSYTKFVSVTFPPAPSCLIFVRLPAWSYSYRSERRILFDVPTTKSLILFAWS